MNERPGERVAGSSTRSRVNLTSSDVISVPSWNFTPRRSLNVTLRESWYSHDSARSPSISSLSLYRTSLLYRKSMRRNDENDVTRLGSSPTISWSTPIVNVVPAGPARTGSAGRTSATTTSIIHQRPLTVFTPPSGYLAGPRVRDLLSPPVLAIG